ncbi:MAG: CopG family antitoxin [Patescibacteria group bacterium]
MSKVKPIPKFSDYEEEANFWDTHDTTDYFDMSKAVRAEFPNLKLSPKTKEDLADIKAVKKLSKGPRGKGIRLEDVVLNNI